MADGARHFQYASYPHIFPSPFPAMSAGGDDSGQLHTRYTSAGTSTTGPDGGMTECGITEWSALTNYGDDDPSPFYGFGCDFGDVSAEVSDSWDGPSNHEDQGRPSFRQHIGTEATRAAAISRRKNPNGKIFFCDICSSTFTAKHNLKNHINSHKSLRPYGCSKCRMCFGTKHVMLRHESKCRRSLLSRKKRMS
ncbi:hypothetical protein FB451DRAFT_1250626 [Mycena latifolia]|nr:hypothetical protein FB451DRAFT_1250626 [Mycena latifolia]